MEYSDERAAMGRHAWERDEMATKLGDSESLLLTERDVARLLACCGRHVRNLSARGVLPKPVKLGTSVRWRREDIRAALEKLASGR